MVTDKLSAIPTVKLSTNPVTTPLVIPPAIIPNNILEKSPVIPSPMPIPNNPPIKIEAKRKVLEKAFTTLTIKLNVNTPAILKAKNTPTNPPNTIPVSNPIAILYQLICRPIMSKQPPITIGVEIVRRKHIIISCLLKWLFLNNCHRCRHVSDFDLCGGSQKVSVYQRIACGK
ncbi:hypothetical protein APA_2571 [Pseudanabaena sp. lw0831]|nr:hypothetical protein APA_2571 [Pseudanabaena sp. lw0831]